MPTWSELDAVGPAFFRVSSVAVFIVPITDRAKVALSGSDAVPPIVSTPGSLPTVLRSLSQSSARSVIASTNWPAGNAFARFHNLAPSTSRFLVKAAYVAAVATLPEATPTMTTGRFEVSGLPVRSSSEPRAGTVRTRFR